MNVQFREIRPSAALRPYVQTYWQGDFNVRDETNFSQSVLPNGCIEIIIHLTHDHCALTGNGHRWDRSPEFTLLGLYERPYDVVFEHPVKVFGIRLFPDGMSNIFNIPPAVVKSSFENVSFVLGEDFRIFCSKVRELKSFGEQSALANQFLEKNLARHIKPFDYTHIAMELIRKTNGIEHYGEVIKQVPISQRQLQREFRNVYGISISDYKRLTRLNAIHRYLQNDATKLTSLTYDLNFTDQSHFTKEYRMFAGITPKSLLKNRNDFIINANSQG